jgi:hypothetical protein
MKHNKHSHCRLKNLSKESLVPDYDTLDFENRTAEQLKDTTLERILHICWMQNQTEHTFLQ